LNSSNKDIMPNQTVPPSIGAVEETLPVGADIRSADIGAQRVKIEGKHGSAARKLLSGSVLRVLSLAASAVSSFFLMPFVVHHLGDRLYGFWSLASVFIGYYSLLDLGLSSAVSQYVCIALGRNDFKECRAVFNTALRIQFWLAGAALVATAAIAAVTPLFTHNAADAHIFRDVVLILGVNTALGFPIKVYGGVLDAQYRFDINAALTIFGLTLRTGLVIWAILSGGTLLALAWATLLASLPVAVLQIWFAKREAFWAKLGAKLENKRVKSLFSYSIYSFLSYLADIVRFQVDPIVISAFVGLATVTHYRVAAILAQQYFLQILVLTVGTLGPVFSRLHGTGDKAQMEEVFLFGTKLSCCISCFICFALVGWGKPFIVRWMGPNYLDAYWPLVILALSVFLDVCQRSSIDLLYATFNHRFYTYLNWAEGILNLAFSLALARSLGLIGVALGTLIAALIVRVIVQPWWVCKVINICYTGYMRFWVGKLLQCFFWTAVAITISAWGLRPNYALMTGSAILATVAYTIACWMFIFNPSERTQLWRAIAHRRQQEIEADAPVEILQQEVNP
jgi:O-antigen/teichoic acid export membrane protein